MQLSNKLSPIILWHAHKSPTHDYKFHLQSRKMNSQENKKAQGIRIFIPYQRRLQLVYSPSRLLVEIITCSNSTHTCRFVTSITLCTIIEIQVRPSRQYLLKILICYQWWTHPNAREAYHINIHAYISCHRNMWTSMEFAHNSNDRNLSQKREI